MLPHYELMIPHCHNSDTQRTITAPFDGSAIATVATADEAAAEQALVNAKACWDNRKQWLSLERRLGILEELKIAILQQQEGLARLAAQEGGKPLRDSRVEVVRGADGIQWCMDHCRSHRGDVIPMGYNAASSHRIAFTQKEPVGIVLAISAFNHPFNLIIHQVVTAVAAGCPVIIKPATDTPLSCLRIVQLLREVGLPEDWCQVLIVKEITTATKVVRDKRLAFFSFIGSGKVGWALRRELAPGVRCALEHGGVAPAILCADADIDRALPLLCKGGFYHAGQVCVSVQRIFAQQTIARSVAEGLAALARVLQVGDPTEETTEVGPLIRPAEVERVHEWVTEAVAQGAQLLCGGVPLSTTTYAPTVLYNPPPDATVSCEEVFGPVVCVYPFASLENAIAQANGLPVAFQGAVFTQDIDTAMMVYQQLEASAVMVNDHTAFRVDAMPFAGLRESGLGVGGIPYTLEDLQVDKLCVIHWTG